MGTINIFICLFSISQLINILYTSDKIVQFKYITADGKHFVEISGPGDTAKQAKTKMDAYVLPKIRYDKMEVSKPGEYACLCNSTGEYNLAYL